MVPLPDCCSCPIVGDADCDGACRDWWRPLWPRARSRSRRPSPSRREPPGSTGRLEQSAGGGGGGAAMVSLVMLVTRAMRMLRRGGGVC